MESIDLIRENLRRSEDLVLLRIEEMAEHCMVYPTPSGGCHTLWVLGHLAYIEALVVHQFMLGGDNPLASWRDLFDGAEVSADATLFPAFEEVLEKCRAMRAETNALLDSFVEDDLDTESRAAPAGYDELFGTRRRCLQYLSDHWYMHRGQLADARRAAGQERMWL